MNPFFEKCPDSLDEAMRLAGWRWTKAAFVKAIDDAMWAGDVDRLDELARCRCCCHEHTFDWCPSRIWGGCRGQGTPTRDEMESWAEHYAKFHGMSRDDFYG